VPLPLAALVALHAGIGLGLFTPANAAIARSGQDEHGGIGTAASARRPVAGRA
jgi:hypothetical protein